jgi:hypothetical protein
MVNKIYIESYEPMRILRKHELNETQTEMIGFVHIEYGAFNIVTAVGVGAKNLQQFKDRFDQGVLMKITSPLFVKSGFVDHVMADTYNLSRQTSARINPSFYDDVEVEIKIIPAL